MVTLLVCVVGHGLKMWTIVKLFNITYFNVLADDYTFTSVFIFWVTLMHINSLPLYTYSDTFWQQVQLQNIFALFWGVNICFYFLT